MDSNLWTLGQKNKKKEDPYFDLEFVDAIIN